MRALRSYCLALLAFTLLAMAPATVRADIFYSYTTTLALSSGPDTMLLNGSLANVTFEVADGATYVNRFGLPAVPVNNPLLTISGSGLAANNGTFALEPTAFYPTFAGFFTEPGGSNIVVLLPGGDNLQIAGKTVPTASGALANIGDTVAVSDFGPATDSGFPWNDDSDGSSYSLVGTTITATQSSAVPEPGSIALLVGMSITGAGFMARRKFARKAA